MKEQLEMERISKEKIVDAINYITYQQKYPYHSDLRIADAQLQADKIVMGNVKRAMKKELENLNYSTDYVDYLLVDRVKLKAFWEKWLGENK